MSFPHRASSQDQNPKARRARGNGGGGLRRFVVVALVIHVEVLLLIGLGVYWLAPRDADIQARLAAAAKESESIDVGMVDEETSQRILADLERRHEEAKAEEVKKEIDSIKAPGQVVDVPKPREERRPDQARFASEYDMSTPMETRKYGKFDEKARQGDTLGTADESRPAAAARPRGSATQEPAPQLAMREPSRRTPPGQASRQQAGEPEPPQPPGSETGAPDDQEAPRPDGEIPRLGKLQMRLGADGQPVGGGGEVALTPSSAQLARALGSGTQDALKDVDEGDETALNSKKWRFAAFFNRVKHQVQEHWHPDDVYRRRDPTGAINGRTNRLTIVRVQLNPNGNLANVELETPSGLDFLDDEALQSFRLAQPFPNPPRQLIDASDGLINFQFGFLFEISGVSRPMLFKYNM